MTSHVLHETYVTYRADGTPRVYEYERKSIRKRIVKMTDDQVRKFLVLVGGGVPTVEAAKRLHLAHSTALKRSFTLMVDELRDTALPAWGAL